MTNKNDFIRRLQFNKKEYEDVLGRMQGAASRPPAGEDRSRDRHEYPIADIPLTIEHPEGGTSRFLVYGRNISRGGLAVLHGGFLHTGSKCRVSLQREDGEFMNVECEVRHCRLVAGSCHEIGIRFGQEIDPSQLKVPSKDEEADEGFLAISGSILVAESFDPDAELLQHHLSMFGVNVLRATTTAETLEMLAANTIDLVLYGLNVATDDGMATIARVREQGFKGPLIALTAETCSDLLDQARKRGATATIGKPYHVDLLVAQLQVHLSKARVPDLLHSTAADQPGMPPLIVHYVKIVRRTADQIQRACAEDAWDAVREHCCHLKGSGCSYGFQTLTVAAIVAIDALDAGLVMKGDTSAIDALVKCCRSLECNLPVGRAA